MGNEIKNRLVFKPHENDKKIELDENFKENHRYYKANGNQREILKSITQMIKSVTAEFDDNIITPARIKKWHEQGKYTNLNTKAEILEFWREKAAKSCELGTFEHLQIENFLKGKPFENTKRLSRFRDFCVKNQKLIPYRNEWSIILEKLNLVGTIDYVVKIKDKEEYIIIDFKTNEEIKKDSFGFFKEPLNNLGNCDFNKYSLQLSFYRYILETDYNLKIRHCYIMHLTENEYKLMKCEYLKEEVMKLLDLREKELKAEKVIDLED